jgi:ribonuclease HI
MAVFYTDGACSGNSGAGGWAIVQIVKCSEGYKTKIESGNKTKTTNNEMELTAVYMALVKSLKEKQKKVTIYSDSAYVVNAITKGWLQNWNRNGWKTKEGRNVKNQNIWLKMYKLIYEKGMEVQIKRVSGHSGDLFNDLADKCAVKAKKAIMEG